MLLVLLFVVHSAGNIPQIFLFPQYVSYSILFCLLACFALLYLMFAGKTATKSIHVTVSFYITMTITVTVLAPIFFHKIFYRYIPDVF